MDDAKDAKKNPRKETPPPPAKPGEQPPDRLGQSVEAGGVD